MCNEENPSPAWSGRRIQSLYRKRCHRYLTGHFQLQHGGGSPTLLTVREVAPDICIKASLSQPWRFEKAYQFLQLCCKMTLPRGCRVLFSQECLCKATKFSQLCDSAHLFILAGEMFQCWMISGEVVDSLQSWPKVKSLYTRYGSGSHLLWHLALVLVLWRFLHAYTQKCVLLGQWGRKTVSLLLWMILRFK